MICALSKVRERLCAGKYSELCFDCKINNGDEFLLPRFEDLKGKTYGELTVLERTDNYISPSGYEKTRWICKCNCGNLTKVTSQDLKRGDVVSCGCYSIKSKIKNATTHGYSKEKLYGTWKGIKARCYNKNHKNYNDYGGRGIVMCNEWKESYVQFRQWCVNNNYESGMTVERINNDDCYSPHNCRLASRKEQASNRRSNRYITYNGESHNIQWWSEKTGIPYNKIHYRISLGNSIDEILKIYTKNTIET